MRIKYVKSFKLKINDNLNKNLLFLIGQCEIEEFKGNNTNGEVNIAKNLTTNFGAVDKLAKECKVFVDVIKSFTRLTEPEEAVPAKEASIFVGEGVMFKLKDLNGKVICEKDCLKSSYRFKINKFYSINIIFF